MLTTIAPTCCINHNSPFDSGGPVNDHILGAFWPIVVVSIIVWVFVSGLIIFAALRFRRKYDDEQPKQIHGNTKLEILWTVIPFIILIVLFGITTYEMAYIKTTPAGAMKIHVTGEQYSWVFDYTGRKTSPTKDVTSITKLFIPADTPVSLDIDSLDVNHSFYVPSLAGQVNAIPGQTNHLWLQAQQGIYYGQCTELCGVGHAQMLLEVHALSSSEFNAWIHKQESGT